MPNHVRTVIKFKKLKKKEDFDMILDMVARPLEDKRDDMFTPDHPDWIIDFDKIIPEPREKEDCDKDCLVTPGSHIAEDKDRPWFDWYKWHIKHWGTKWNAYDGYTIHDPHSLTFVFSTAWSVAEPIVDRLTLLGYDMDIKYADEDWGRNCGTMTYKVNDGWDSTTEDFYKDPCGFAKRLWDKY